MKGFFRIVESVVMLALLSGCSMSIPQNELPTLAKLQLPDRSAMTDRGLSSAPIGLRYFSLSFQGLRRENFDPKKEDDKMRRRMFLIAAVMLAAYLVAASAHADQADVDQAVAIIESFQKIPEKAIPTAVLRNARGLAILTVTKAGFIVSGRGGKGIVIARTGKGWSGPSAIGTGGMGFGFQAGAQVTEVVIVLNTPAAVEAFSQDGDFTLGGNLSVTAGPIGRNAEARIGLQAVMYSYSRSQGLFGGLSVEGTVIGTRKDDNAAYYGKPVQAKDILSGKVAAPAGARKLRQILSKW
jgi:lipid-binding SYLF domain-containing protein